MAKVRLAGSTSGREPGRLGFRPARSVCGHGSVTGHHGVTSGVTVRMRLARFGLARHRWASMSPRDGDTASPHFLDSRFTSHGTSPLSGCGERWCLEKASPGARNATLGTHAAIRQPRIRFVTQPSRSNGAEAPLGEWGLMSSEAPRAGRHLHRRAAFRTNTGSSKQQMCKGAQAPGGSYPRSLSGLRKRPGVAARHKGG